MGEEKTYIGTKVVKAEPMDGPEGAGPGYKVVYEDGYTSWSPAEVFRRCYREITEAEKAMM